MIYDPDANKPEDWDDKEYILDPEDKKPEGYDDIPKEITDPDAKKPEDWDDEEDGEWVAPTIPNLEYKGEWKPKVKSGTLFDNVLVCDDPEYAKQLAEETWGKQKDAAFEEYEKKKEEEKSSIHTCSLLDTDEIFAQMSLQPVKSENDVFHVADFGMKPSRHPTKLFCKTLTTSDTSTHGGFSMPRRAAEKLFLHWISI